MNREEIIIQVRETLSNTGFYISELYSMRQVGFDLVARRDNSLLIIKVLTNIDAFSEDVSIVVSKSYYIQSRLENIVDVSIDKGAVGC